jgi:hypothetical protein
MRKVTPAILLLSAASAASSVACARHGVVAGRPYVLMDFDTHDFLASPFPGSSYQLRKSLAGYPIGARRCQVNALRALAESTMDQGFSLTSAIYFQLVSDEATNLGPLVCGNSPMASIKAGFPVLLADVDGASRGLHRHPVTLEYHEEDRLLSVRPAPGFPLEPNKQYVVAVLRSATSPRLDPADAMAELEKGSSPPGMSPTVHQEYLTALDTLRHGGVRVADVAAMTTFRTADPVAWMRAAVGDAREDMSRAALAPMCHPEQKPTAGWPATRIPALTYAPELSDTGNPGTCGFQGTIMMPVYQKGTIPYGSEGGYWDYDNGHLKLQCYDEARIVVTIPRASMPAGGFPTVVFVRAGAGGTCTPMVDRQAGWNGSAGHCFDDGNKTQGPALFFAAAGFAGLSIDGPHTGMRTRADGRFFHDQIMSGEDGDIFNILNMYAMRDNVRQSALEVALEADLVDRIQLTPDARCPGMSATPVRLTTDHLSLFSHSMGSTISPLALAVEPRYRGVVFSGEGGSYVEQLLYKEKPYPLRSVFTPFARLPKQLTTHDPVLNLFQWAMEAADPPVFARDAAATATARPRSVLMVQGIVDNYVGVPMANCSSVSMGLDVADPEIDDDAAGDLSVPMLKDYLEVEKEYLSLDPKKRKDLLLPIQGNVAGAGDPATAVVVQRYRYDKNGNRDSGLEGHEVIYEEKAPKYMYRCFLESFRTGVPRVPDPGGVVDELRDPCVPAPGSSTRATSVAP